MIFAGANNGIYKSTDAGATWHQTFIGGPTSAIAINPDDPQTVYAAVGLPGRTYRRGLLKTTDGGEHWQLLRTGTTDAGGQDLTIDPADPNTIYAATDGAGVLRSTNAGNTWQPLNTNLPVHGIGALAIDSRRGVLYAGTLGGGVVTHPLR